MNNDQLEACLRELKSSSRGPDQVDKRLEDQMVGLQMNLNRKRKTNRLVAVSGLLVLCVTSFFAMKGDAAVLNYFVVAPTLDSSGEPISDTEPRFVGLFQYLHDHLLEHFRSHHHGE